MNLYTSISETITKLHQACSDLEKGIYPSIHVLHQFHADLISHHHQLGELTSTLFGARERAEMDMDNAEDTSFLDERYNPEDEQRRTAKTTAEDAKRLSRLATLKEKQLHIAAAQEYELHKRLLDSVENSIQFCIMQISWIKKAENYTQ